jgi:hypothetical protein
MGQIRQITHTAPTKMHGQQQQAPAQGQQHDV